MRLRKHEKRRGQRGNYRGLALLFSLIPLFVITFLNVSSAAEYPTKPIQIIVPFPPGGDTDVIARLLFNKLSSLLGQSVVVVNKPGGGGIVGINAVKNSLPDGYTILATPTVMLLAPLFAKNIAFSFQDFITINVAVTGPNIVVVKKDAPWMTLEDLVVDAKKNPGKFSYSAPGYGSTGHFAGELFKVITATDITCVPFDGMSPAHSAVLGGHVNMVFSTFAGSFSLTEAGTVRALATMGSRRSKKFPNIPTVVEKGYAKAISVVFQAYFVPAKTPQVIVKKLEQAFKEVDLIFTPTSPTPPFKIGEKVTDPLQMYLSDIFTIPVNIAGIPGISIPCGFSRENLPIGLQMMGKHFDEGMLLRVGYAFEQNTDFHLKKPAPVV